MEKGIAFIKRFASQQSDQVANRFASDNNNNNSKIDSVLLNAAQIELLANNVYRQAYLRTWSRSGGGIIKLQKRILQGFCRSIQSMACFGD